MNLHITNKLSKFVSFLCAAVVLAGMAHLAGFTQSNFNHHQQNFSWTFISKEAAKDEIQLTYRVANNTWRDWEWLHYEIIYNADDRVVYSVADADLTWKISAGEEKLLIVNVPLVAHVTSFELSIKELRNSRRFSF